MAPDSPLRNASPYLNSSRGNTPKCMSRSIVSFIPIIVGVASPAISAKSLAPFFKSSHRMTRLHLDYALPTPIDSDSLDHLFNPNFAKNLTVLRLLSCHSLNDAQLSFIADTCPSLTELSFGAPPPILSYGCLPLFDQGARRSPRKACWRSPLPPSYPHCARCTSAV